MLKDLNLHIPEKDLELTACQFFSKYASSLQSAFGWADSTYHGYSRQINNLQNYLNISITDAVVSDYELSISDMNSHKKRPYKEGSLKTFRSVLNDIFYFIEVYSDGNFMSNLWGSAWNSDGKKFSGFTSKEDRIKEQIDRKLRTPRSLSIPEEIKFLNEIKANYMTNSFYLGAAIIFYLGLRPGECCGLKYSDIRPLNGHPDAHCLYIYQQIRSTRERTNDLKTTNAYRIVPIPHELYLLLDNRKQEIKQKLGSDFNDDMPIVCMSDSADGYGKYCDSKKFMLHCTKLLRICEVEEGTLGALSLDLRKSNPFKEAEATAYLLRRNFATAIAGVCGMTPSEINYMMGHAIYIPNERRADFINPDLLYKLFKKLNRRHYDRLPKDTNYFELKDGLVIIHQRMAKIEVTQELLDKHPNGIKFTVWDDYPNDYIDIKNLSDSGLKMEIRPIYQHVPLRKAERVWMSREFTEAVSTSKNRSKAKRNQADLS